jgi:hypothetical protein
MDSNSTLIGVALIERILLEDIEGIQALCGVLSEKETGDLVQFYSTIIATLLLERYGLTGSIERVHDWRTAALAGAADADA